jgi:hypothetical protein
MIIYHFVISSLYQVLIAIQPIKRHDLVQCYITQILAVDNQRDSTHKGSKHTNDTE